MKKIITLCLSLCMTATLAAPAYALEYSIDAPNDYDFGKDTSIEVIHTADGGAMRNEDVSKNAALIPPVFGSESMNALHTGEYLTPNLAPRTLPTAGAVISGSGDVVTPGSTVIGGNGYQPAVLFTDVTSELYYRNASLGKLEIPMLDLSVRIYQGTDSKTLAKGVGHFEDTSIWEGNVCLAAHNRGTNSYFGQIHTLNIGDKITLTTKLGTRTYKVTDVSKVRDRPQRSCGLRREYAHALHLRPQPARPALVRHRGRDLIFSPFCRIGSIRLLPVACDMVKLRGRFPHTHLEWRQNDEQIEEYRARPLRSRAGAFAECSRGAGGGIAESNAFHKPRPCRRAGSPPDGVQHQRQ